MIRFFLLFLVTFSCHAQEYFGPVGAKSWGLANAMVAKTHSHAVFGNPATINHSFLSSSYHSGFINPAFGVKTVVGGLQLNKLNLGVGFQHFGDLLFSENQINIGANVHNKQYAIGLKAVYQGRQIKDDASTNLLAFDFGLWAKLFPTFHLGFQVKNLTKSEYSPQGLNPMQFVGGFNFLVNNKVELSAQAELIKNIDPIVTSGISYKVHKFIELRMGVNATFKQYHFGLGLNKKNLELDFATSTDPNLGLRQHIGLVYSFKPTKDE